MENFKTCFVKGISAVFFFLFFSLSGSAHEVRPAYFSLTQTSDSIFQIIWKLPAMGDAIPMIYPTLPNQWKIKEEKSFLLPGNLRRTYSVLIPNKPGGYPIFFDGLDKTLIDVLVSVKMLNGVQYSSMVKPSHPTYIIPSEPDQISVIRTYTILGIEHILAGIDHLLFVLALLLITKGFKRLIKTITAFTNAHSNTLSMATMGVVGLPGPPVEAVIALSIVFLAQELIHLYQGQEGYTSRFPWVVAFTFGLLHGFGFAGALADVGLPQSEIPLALLFFNIGVELGQIIFIFIVLSFIWLIRKTKITLPSWIRLVPPYAIGSVASFWLIERVIGFVS